MLIAFPNVDDQVRESRIAQKQNPKTQESEVQHLAFLQNRILYQDQFCLFLRSIRILHERLKKFLSKQQKPKKHIGEHMEVGSDGQHVGTVDKVEGDQIKLTKKDSADGQHHMLIKSLVSGIEGNKIKLSVKAADASKAA